MQTPRLIFHPKSATHVCPQESLLPGLHEIGFIGERLEAKGPNCYAAGEHFIELLTFLGCSPVINLSPEDGDKYCYIELQEYTEPQLVYGSQPFQPRCRKCRQPLENWLQQSQQYGRLNCDLCQHEMALEQANWKQAAGYASQFIVVHNIYLHEAVPGEKLLMSLEKLCQQQSWKYFYAL